MASKGITLRVDEGLLEWLDEYARQRGSTRTDLLLSAVETFREDAERGVPEIRAAVRRQVALSGNLEGAAGVGDCPERPGELGHVWAGAGRSGNASNPCTFCGTSGREFFERATAERSELFATLRTPDSIANRKPR